MIEITQIYPGILLFDLMLVRTNNLDVAQQHTFSTKCLFALTQLIIDYLSESYSSPESELNNNLWLLYPLLSPRVLYFLFMN